jgi:hypothetical protein
MTHLPAGSRFTLAVDVDVRKTGDQLGQRLNLPRFSIGMCRRSLPILAENADRANTPFEL